MPANPAGATQAVELPPPPTFGREMAQLVVIPAVIVVVCIGLALLFGWLAGAEESVDNLLLKLQQSSGAGQLPLGMQDPRYKDRCLAAYNIASIIRDRGMDPVEKQRISESLLEVLKHNVADHELLLRAYLLMAIGQLGQDGGLEAILSGFDSPHAQVRQAAIMGVLSWPDREALREAVPVLRDRLGDEDPAVRATSAAALGVLARGEDEGVIEALRRAMEPMEPRMREARWNAAVALARLGDAQGSRLVAGLLLDRAALSGLSAGESGADAQIKMPAAMVDRIMLATLESASVMTDAQVWDKIGLIAENDPSLPVREGALRLIQGRGSGSESSGGASDLK
jgi:HEAT repeat protein